LYTTPIALAVAFLEGFCLYGDDELVSDAAIQLIDRRVDVSSLRCVVDLDTGRRFQPTCDRASQRRFVFDFLIECIRDFRFSHRLLTSFFPSSAVLFVSFFLSFFACLFL